MRKLIFAALLCAAPLAVPAPVHAEAATRSGVAAMLIPVYTTQAEAGVTPVQYRYHHRWHRRHRYYRHYR